MAVALLTSVGALAQGVWKWVDKNGVPHYSDQPVPGAVRVDLNVQTYESSEATITPTPRTTPSDSPSRPAQAAVTYTLIEVWKPENDQTIIGTGGQVSVQVRVQPDIGPNHSLRLELDGLRVSEPESRATAFDLKDVPRGTHTLQASVVTRDGTTLIRSEPIKFHVIQPIARRP